MIESMSVVSGVGDMRYPYISAYMYAYRVMYVYIYIHVCIYTYTDHDWIDVNVPSKFLEDSIHPTNDTIDINVNAFLYIMYVSLQNFSKVSFPSSYIDKNVASRFLGILWIFIWNFFGNHLLSAIGTAKKFPESALQSPYIVKLAKGWISGIISYTYEDFRKILSSHVRLLQIIKSQLYRRLEWYI